MDQPRYLRRVEYLALALVAILTLLAAQAEPLFAALQLNHRLYLFILWSIIAVVIAGVAFSVGWQTFASDRNWPITLVSTFILGAGLFNAYHLFSLNVYVGDKSASVQHVATLALWARMYIAVGLLLAASVSPTRSISTPARFCLLFGVLGVAALIFSFTASRFYPDFLATIFVDQMSAEMHAVIPGALVCVYIVAAGMFSYRLHHSARNWLSKFLLSVCLLALAEFNFMLMGASRNAHAQLGSVLMAFGFMYVYRGVFLYSIQWPIDQMNDWQARLKTSQRELAVTKLAVDGSGYYIFEFDESSNIRYVSDNFRRRMGCEKDELIGASFDSICANSGGKLLAQQGAHVSTGDTPNRIELELITRRGEIFPVATTITHIGEDAEQHVYAIMEDISDRKRFEAQLAENERYLRRVIDSIPFYVTILTPDGYLIDNNQVVLQSLKPRDKLSGTRLIDIVLPFLVDRSQEHTLLDAIAQARSGQTVALELHLNTDDGDRFVEFTLAPVRDDAGNVVNLVNTSADITDRLLAQNELKLASTVFDYSAEAILITDGHKKTLSANRAFTTITGFEESEMLGHVPALFDSGKHLQAMQAGLDTAGNWSGEVEWPNRNGGVGYEWITVTLVLGAEQAVHNYIVIFSDITEKKRSEEYIQYLAYYDPLTNLPNRVLLDDRVKQAIATAKRDNHKVAVIFLDLDHFKTINDSLGHHRGDLLLTEVAQRLSRTVRETDTVARQSGDEFVIVLPGLEQAESATTVARNLLAELQLPYLIDGTELRVTVSIGISIYPDDGEDFSRLIMNADAAMYHAKENGRNNVQFFIGEMNRRAAELLDMETRLRRAIEREEFLLHFQPQVDMRSGNIVSFEALVRWRDPENGLIMPGSFIPVAENRGFVTQIDDFVLRAACLQNRTWQLAGLPMLPIAVNVSAKQFRDKYFVNRVREALSEARLEAKYLELEVTETVVMQGADDLLHTLDELRRLGVRLAIDDFGTGYSSLSYLKRFPIDKIKIDSSFIRDIPDDKDDLSIVRAIIGLTQQLNLRAVAEGVETIEQLKALRQLDCNEYQGYYFSAPVSAEQAARLMGDGRLRKRGFNA